LAVINDLDPLATAILPDEAKAPLVIDSNTVLTRVAAAQRFQPISGRSRQIAQLLCIMKLPQLPLRQTLNTARQSPREPAME
jgi:hypothetical protein